MTILERMAEILRVVAMGGNPPLLTDLVLDVRSSINGSADPLPREELERVLEAFRFRLGSWTLPESPIDVAVRQMVEEGAKLIEIELEERTEAGWAY